jgi:hypothetical protein
VGNGCRCRFQLVLDSPLGGAFAELHLDTSCTPLAVEACNVTAGEALQASKGEVLAGPLMKGLWDQGAIIMAELSHT